jgi:hypothetical protein
LKRAQGGALKQPVTVLVHGGTYRLSRTLLFAPEDSGAADCPVVYRSFRDEKPVISGGRPITGWKETTVAGKTLWVADIPEVREGKWHFRQLWAGEDRRTLARNPNQGFFRVTAVPDSNMLVEKNITYNTSTAGYGQSFGKGNVIRNNIFAFGRDAQLEPNGGRPNLPPGNNFTYERNIVYWEKSHNVLRAKWNDTDVVLRKNLYWQEGGGEIRFGPESWEQWRARGMDEGSLVADPLFVDPGRRDFRLKRDSPALKIGFEPFDLSQVGPRPALLRELAK